MANSQLSELSEEELDALIADSEVQAAPVVPSQTTNGGVASMSDEQLDSAISAQTTRWEDLSPEEQSSHKKVIGRGFAEAMKTVVLNDPTVGHLFKGLEKTNPEFMTDVAAGLTAVPEGVTGEFFDELVGVALGDKAKQATRFVSETVSEEFPKAHIAGEVLGAAGAGGSVLAKQGVVRGGAIAGGVFGAGGAEGDVKERIAPTLKGAGLGLAFGGALSLLGKVASPAIKATLKKISSGKKIKLPAEVKARNIIVKAAMKKGKTGEEVKSILNEVAATGGDEQMIWQRLGLLDEAQGFAAAQTPAKRFASQQVQKARDLQKGNIEKIMQGSIGDLDFSVMKNGITSRLKDASKLYDDVLSQEIVETKGLTALRKDPFFKKATTFANKAAASEKRRLGNVSQARYLQLVKEELDTQINSLVRKGKGGRTKPIKAVRDELLDEMDNQLAGFKEVRGLWGGEAANKNALAEGRRVLLEEPRDIAEAIGKMSESEKRHYMTGMLDALSKKLSSRADNADLTRILNDRTRQQIAAVLPEEQADKFFKGFSKEAKTRAELNIVDPFSGSPTQPRQEAAEAARRSTLGVGQKLTARTANFFSQPIQNTGGAVRWIGARAAKEDPDVMYAVTRILFSTPDEAAAAYQSLTRQQQQKAEVYFRQIWPASAGVAAEKQVNK